MYISGMSRRTQITFTDRQHELLIDESNRTGLPMAELVRRAVDRTFRSASRKPLVRGFELSLGLWRDLDAAFAARRVMPRKPRLYDDSI
jgi:hypothetical protein